MAEQDRPDPSTSTDTVGSNRSSCSASSTSRSPLPITQRTGTSSASQPLEALADHRSWRDVPTDDDYVGLDLGEDRLERRQVAVDVVQSRDAHGSGHQTSSRKTISVASDLRGPSLRMRV